MKAKEWLFTNYPQVKEDWCKTGHDDKYMVRMMEEYHESQLKILNIPVVNTRYLTQFIKAIKEMNPYPVDVFLEPSEEDWNDIGKFLQEHGKNPDRIFAKWGRMVWENCVGCMEYFNS